MISPAELLRLAAIAAGVLCAVMFLRTLSAIRQSRRARYYSARRDAGRLSQRRVRITVQLGLLAVLLFVSSNLLDNSAKAPRPAPSVPKPAATSEAFVMPALAAKMERAANPTSSPTLSPTSTPIPPPTPTELPPSPTVVLPSPTPALVRIEPSPTIALIPLVASPTPEVTATATPSAEDAASPPATSVPSTVNGPALKLRAITTQPPLEGAPETIEAVFPAGTPTIYIAFDYRAVPPSAGIRHTWFRDGSSVHFDSLDLVTGDQMGIAFIAWSPEGGFQVGLYEVRVMLGGSLQFVANFEVR